MTPTGPLLLNKKFPKWQLESEALMSDYNWCHGPKCHERETTTRVRGVKGSKVLRTVKINVSGLYPQGMWKYFCDLNRKLSPHKIQFFTQY